MSDHTKPREQGPHPSPEAAGISSTGVLAFVDEVDRTIRDLHSFMMLRHGRVVAQGWWAPYTPEILHELFSVSKSFIATAIGLAVGEGRLSVEDRVVDLLPDDAPANGGEDLAALQVRHLLSMTTGHDPRSQGMVFGHPEGNWVRGFLSQPFIHRPGTVFFYENATMFVLSAIVQRVTGKSALAYLEPHLFAPLGIDHATWSVGPGDVNVGFTGLRLTTDAVTRFGQLYLQEGTWEGRQLIARDWVREATRQHFSIGDDSHADGARGYGYGFWTLDHGAYRGDGAFGQFCEIWPEQGVVLAITGGKEGMKAIHDLVWGHLFPAVSGSALPEDREASAALTSRLARLTIPLPRGEHVSPTAARVTGRRYALRSEPSDATPLVFDVGHGPFEVIPHWISFTFGPDECLCTFHDDRGTHGITCGHGAWRPGISTIQSTAGDTPQRVAAAGAWTAEDTYEMQWCFTEGAFRSTLICRFADNHLTIDWHENASFAEQPIPRLLGEASARD